MAGPVHYIYHGGEFTWQHWRAIATAKDHEAPIVMWIAKPIPSTAVETSENQAWHALVYGHWPNGFEFRRLDLPDWLREHPIKLSNVKDLYAWRILYEHGGLYLDLDTISLPPVWDLLDRDVLI